MYKDKTKIFKPNKNLEIYENKKCDKRHGCPADVVKTDTMKIQ